MRKAASEKLSTSSVKEFYETQMKEAVVQACDLLDKPSVFLTPLLWVLTWLSFSPGYDISQAGECRHPQHNRLSLKSYDSLAKWKRDAEASYKQDSLMLEGLLHTVKTNVV
jgi:hypothetical protein